MHPWDSKFLTSQNRCFKIRSWKGKIWNLKKKGKNWQLLSSLSNIKLSVSFEMQILFKRRKKKAAAFNSCSGWCDIFFKEQMKCPGGGVCANFRLVQAASWTARKYRCFIFSDLCCCGVWELVLTFIFSLYICRWFYSQEGHCL